MKLRSSRKAGAGWAGPGGSFMAWNDDLRVLRDFAADRLLSGASDPDCACHRPARIRRRVRTSAVGKRTQRVSSRWLGGVKFRNGGSHSGRLLDALYGWMQEPSHKAWFGPNADWDLPSRAQSASEITMATHPQQLGSSLGPRPPHQQLTSHHVNRSRPPTA